MSAGEGRGRRGGGPQAGQATVELALVLPVLVMLALIAVQVGLVAKDLLLVHHAAREGARAAAVDPSAAAARTAASGAASLDPARMVVSLSGGAATGDRATVTVTYHAPTDVPLVGWLVPDVTVDAAVTMRVE